MADTQEFLDDLLNAHAQEFKAGHLDTIKKAILQHFQQEQERAKAEVGELLKGIDKDEVEEPDGWWETSTGAEFGAKVKKRVLSVFDSSTSNQPFGDNFEVPPEEEKRFYESLKAVPQKEYSDTFQESSTTNDTPRFTQSEVDRLIREARISGAMGENAMARVALNDITVRGKDPIEVEFGMISRYKDLQKKLSKQEEGSK